MKITLTVLLLLTAATSFAQVDFSGKWKLNIDKSEFNGTPDTSAARKLFVEQGNGTIAFQRNDRAKESFKMNTAEEIIVNEADYKTKVVMKPAADKKGLIETRSYIYPEGNREVHATKKTRTWKLADDKQTLIIQDHIESNSDHHFEMTLVYDRR